MEKKYSQELCQYLGELELNASRARSSYKRYEVYYNALYSLHGTELSKEDSRLARDILRTRVKETQPWNIGCASGEAGEAD